MASDFDYAYQDLAGFIVPVTVIYILLFLSGIIGNVFICFVIVKTPYMHTSTNCYLFSLAVADILMLLFGVPMELYSFWMRECNFEFPSFVCTGRALLAEMTTCASVMTITAFTVERYLAICHPFRTERLVTVSRSRTLVILIWLFALFLAAPFAHYAKVNHVYYPLDDSLQRIPGTGWCSFDHERQRQVFALFLCHAIAFFFLPMGLLTVLYGLIALTLRSPTKRYQLSGMHARSGTSESSNSESLSGASRTQSRKSTILMLVAVCLVFFLSWSPFHAQRLLWSTVDRWDQQVTTANAALYMVAGCAYYGNGIINVIIYNVMSFRFRQAFRETVCHRKRRSVSLDEPEHGGAHNAGTVPSTPRHPRSHATNHTTIQPFTVYTVNP
ncbi:neuropeptides capa receptor-like [Paramacrobiotus metropolitanus]|uniref:neuropeptides capa receptor-like n=1 Tax=Paramacrobiotus metropolitanus TaxID=2943436 RepID=UPI002445D5D3|nr:neuropeptides capa receptor-like [Paramacrobiotus metropolitanus]